jgi:hypothetical protein
MKLFSHHLLSTLALAALLTLSVSNTMAQAQPPAPSAQNSDGRRVWLPRSIATAVRQDLAPKINQLPQSLTITQATRQVWPNRCLGIVDPAALCAPGQVPGWQVTVKSSDRAWVYHTDASGRRLALEPAQTSAFPASVVFRSVTSGGLIGRQSTIDLSQDGRLIASEARSQTTTVIRRLSPAEIQAFERQLRQHRFSQLQGRSFAPPAGAADFFGHEFSNAQGAVNYADGSAIPADLQAIAALWQQLVTR